MAKPRNYRAEYRRRALLARQRGFGSYWQERRSPRYLRRSSDFGALPESARQSRTDALRVLGLARRKRMTVEAAARELGVPMATARYWVADALEPTRKGRTLPRTADRLTRLRPLLFEGESELVFVTVRGSRAADRADQVFQLQWDYITGRASAKELERIRSVRLGGCTAEFDPERLKRVAQLGGFDVPEAYREILG